MAFTVIKTFVAKPPMDSVSQQLTKVMEWISEDAGAMMVVKTKECTDFLNEVKDDIAKKKVSKPLLKLGTDSGHLWMRVEGEKDYEKKVTVVKNYVDEKEKRAKATVVNADKGDKTIDSSADRMAKAKGTTAQDADSVDLNAKGSKVPIIILAHGAPSSPIPGTVYAKEFANKKPTEIIKYLVDDKKLDKNYAGVVYLDGCYTAAGPKQGKDAGELNNFAKTVYDGLVKAGYKYLQVKGNLGMAITRASGDETVLDAQTEAEMEQKKKEYAKEYHALKEQADAVKARVEKLEKVATALVAKHNGNAETLKADIGIKLVKEEVDKLEVLRSAADGKVKDVAKKYHAIQKELDRAGKEWIDNLVGVFGPEKLASKPWYKKLFS